MIGCLADAFDESISMNLLKLQRGTTQVYFGFWEEKRGERRGGGVHIRTPIKEGNGNINKSFKEEKLGFIWIYDKSYNYLSIKNFNFRHILYFSRNLQNCGSCIQFKYTALSITKPSSIHLRSYYLSVYHPLILLLLHTS